MVVSALIVAGVRALDTAVPRADRSLPSAPAAVAPPAIASTFCKSVVTSALAAGALALDWTRSAPANSKPVPVVIEPDETLIAIRSRVFDTPPDCES